MVKKMIDAKTKAWKKHHGKDLQPHSMSSGCDNHCYDSEQDFYDAWDAALKHAENKISRLHNRLLEVLQENKRLRSELKMTDDEKTKGWHHRITGQTRKYWIIRFTIITPIIWYILFTQK